MSTPPKVLALIRRYTQYIAGHAKDPSIVNSACFIEWLVDALEGDEEAIAALRDRGIDIDAALRSKPEVDPHGGMIG